jgi:hypothetical protein
VRSDGNGGWASHASKVGQDGSLWGAILEKALAKYHGNYEHTVGGNPAMSLRTLYGAPEKYIMHNEAENTADKIWTEITAAEARHDVILMGTEGSNDSHQNEVGLALGHAYTVLGTKLLKDASGNDIKLVKIRNPWGSEDYRGAYSDNSDKWTPALREAAGSVIKNDGEFFMPIDDYKKWCGETYINFNVDNMSRATFLVLDDTNTETRSEGKCGGTCSYHKFTLKSASDQKVYLKLATWEHRGAPKQCIDQFLA